MLEKGIYQKIKQYKQNSDEVVFTFDTHDDNYFQTQEGRNLPVPHCLRNTEGWDLYGEIADLCDETSQRFKKITFGSLELADYLTNKNYDSVELIGVAAYWLANHDGKVFGDDRDGFITIPIIDENRVHDGSTEEYFLD